MIKIQEEVYTEIVNHAQKESPIEACGYLAGKNDIITKHYKLTNIDNSPEHYSFDPKEQFATVKDARNLGLDILAAYHSHPASPARMSDEDIRLAYDPNIHYIIVSLADGVNIKAFKVKKNNVENVNLELINE
jgi:proteasome lid subunit RPN8/RPN11